MKTMVNPQIYYCPYAYDEDVLYLLQDLTTWKETKEGRKNRGRGVNR